MHISLATVSATEFRWLEEALHRTFGDFEPGFLEAMKHQLDWVRLASGDTLFRQDDREDTLYFVVAGRLRAAVRDELGGQRSVGDIRRGETLGEMALFTGEPRSATVTAVRDSLLVRLSRTGYEQLIRAYPLVSLHVSRFVVERIRRSGDPRAAWARPTTVALLPATPGARCTALAAELLPALARYGRTGCLDPARLREVLGSMSPESAGADDWARVSRWVDDTEAANDLILLVSDDADSAWSRQCLRHADEVIWLAVAGDAPPAGEPPAGLREARVRQTLLLRHDHAPRTPRGTGAWLQRYPADAHLHLRQGHAGDLARLARVLMGRANGVVFGGGGARGFAHLGVLKALEECHIPVDHVGGCSIGAVMAALASFDLGAGEAIAVARRAFSRNPTGDFNLVPIVSLIKGHLLREVIDSGVRDAAGFDADLEDCWKPLYCIASNYSRATEAVLTRGNLARAVRASVSIPAALPPVVIDGDLIVDGGTFNNFPTDVMARMGAGHILGCDLMRENLRKLDLEEFPSARDILVDRMRRRRRYKVPALSSIILNVSILHSQSRLQASRALTDVCFTPDLGRIGMLDWKAFDRAVEAGYRHAMEKLAALPEPLRQRLQG